MIPITLGTLVVAIALAYGLVLAARQGFFRIRTPEQYLPPLDWKQPLAVHLISEVRALDALPITTKEERAAWYAAAESFRKRLYSVYASIYDQLPHELEHYLSDADIRAKDQGYAKYQKDTLPEFFHS